MNASSALKASNLCRFDGATTAHQHPSTRAGPATDECDRRAWWFPIRISADPVNALRGRALEK